MRWIFVWGALGGMALACSAADSGSSGTGGGGGSGATGTGGSFNTDASIADGSSEPPPAVAQLTGKVFAPQGSLPISGALVYLGSVEPIPDSVYCDLCVELPSETPYTFSEPDGSFVLPAYRTGSQQLVVQKGQFRRTRWVDVVEGEQAVAKELTTLPRRTDPALGDNVPKMAVVRGAWDAIQVSLAKLGLADLQPGPFNLGSQVVPGSASFEIIDSGPRAFLGNYAELSKYHVVFLPCSGSNGTTCNETASTDPTVQANLQKYVRAGGKLYVTDYSYDFVRQPFPGYVDWVQQTSALGSACLSSEYDAPARAVDSGLDAWLKAVGVQSFQVEANWTIVDKVNPVNTTDVDGNPVTVEPKVWVEGDVPNYGFHPNTLSFVHGCGRVLFSTYHTEADNSGPTAPLLPQEAALMYVLLEVGVCVAPPSVR